MAEAAKKTQFRAGTKKQTMFERFVTGGDEAAKKYGTAAKLSKNTMNSWLSAFRKLAKRRTTAKRPSRARK